MQILAPFTMYTIYIRMYLRHVCDAQLSCGGHARPACLSNKNMTRTPLTLPKKKPMRKIIFMENVRACTGRKILGRKPTSTSKKTTSNLDACTCKTIGRVRARDSRVYLCVFRPAANIYRTYGKKHAYHPQSHRPASELLI